MYKAKTATEYKPKNGIWIPFAEREKISKLMQHAFDEGLKLHWNEPFIEPDPLIYPKTIELHSDNRATSKTVQLSK